MSLFLVPFLLIPAHLFGLLWNIKNRQYIEHIRSFAAGFSVSYVFLILLPEIYRIETGFLPLVGFIVFHLSHKFVFRVRERADRTKLLDEIHLTTVAIYNFLIAFSLVELMRVDFWQGLVISILLAVHTILSDLTHAETHEKFNRFIKLGVIILFTWLGSMLAIFQIANATLTTTLFSLSAGAIIYITTREEIPEQTSGNPLVFVLGAVVLISGILAFF